MLSPLTNKSHYVLVANTQFLSKENLQDCISTDCNMNWAKAMSAWYVHDRIKANIPYSFDLIFLRFLINEFVGSCQTSHKFDTKQMTASWPTFIEQNVHNWQSLSLMLK